LIERTIGYTARNVSWNLSTFRRDIYRLYSVYDIVVTVRQ